MYVEFVDKSIFILIDLILFHWNYRTKRKEIHFPQESMKSKSNALSNNNSYFPQTKKSKWQGTTNTFTPWLFHSHSHAQWTMSERFGEEWESLPFT